MNPWTAAGIFVGELAVLVLLFLAFHRRGYKKGEKAGFQRGYQEGFSDAQKYSELWWEVADNEVRDAQEKIRNQERWP
jgi:hypothetical protein